MVLLAAHTPLIAAGLATFGIGLLFLVRPLAYFSLPSVRETFSAQWVSKPATRIQMRALGLLISLFGLFFLSATLSGTLKLSLLAGIRERLFTASVATFCVYFLGALMAGLLGWVRPIRRRFTRAMESAAWIRWETRVSCLLLISIVSVVVALAFVRPGK